MSITIDESGTDGKPKVTVLAQIMDMEASSKSQWKWTQKYICFENGKTNATNNTTSQHNFAFQIPGTLVHPVGTSVVPAKSMSPLNEDEIPLLTWSLKHMELTDILDSACAELNPDSDEIIGNIQLLPSLLGPKVSYNDCNGKRIIFSKRKKILTIFYRSK